MKFITPMLVIESSNVCLKELPWNRDLQEHGHIFLQCFQRKTGFGAGQSGGVTSQIRGICWEAESRRVCHHLHAGHSRTQLGWLLTTSLTLFCRQWCSITENFYSSLVFRGRWRAPAWRRIRAVCSSLKAHELRERRSRLLNEHSEVENPSTHNDRTPKTQFGSLNFSFHEKKKENLPVAFHQMHNRRSGWTFISSSSEVNQHIYFFV